MVADIGSRLLQLELCGCYSNDSLIAQRRWACLCDRLAPRSCSTLTAMDVSIRGVQETGLPIFENVTQDLM